MDENEINLSIKGADVGVLYIIQHELLKNSNTDFAGVIVKHPLTNECWMRVNSKTKPIQQIKKAVDTAKSTTSKFEELFNATIKSD